MDRKNLGLNIPYKDKLNNEEKERYRKKIADVDLAVHPLLPPDRCMSSLTLTKIEY